MLKRKYPYLLTPSICFLRFFWFARRPLSKPVKPEEQKKATELADQILVERRRCSRWWSGFTELFSFLFGSTFYKFYKIIQNCLRAFHCQLGFWMLLEDGTVVRLNISDKVSDVRLSACGGLPKVCSSIGRHVRRGSARKGG